MKALQNTKIDEFINLLKRGYEAWIEAGKIVANALEEDPDFADKVHEYHPEISVDTVYAFDRIGRRELHPKLVMSDTPGSRKLRRMPYHIQEKYCDMPVPLLIKSDGKWDTLKVSVFNLTTDQAAQVFDSDGVRGEGAQRAWLEDKSASTSVQVDDPYRVVGRKLIVLQKCQFSAKQLATILSQME